MGVETYISQVGGKVKVVELQSLHRESPRMAEGKAVPAR